MDNLLWGPPNVLRRVSNNRAYCKMQTWNPWWAPPLSLYWNLLRAPKLEPLLDRLLRTPPYNPR
eukprot:1977019-Lingulodinium_polyedra.AAC.1